MPKEQPSVSWLCLKYLSSFITPFTNLSLALNLSFSLSLCAANAYEQLAKKIWRPTVTDAQLGMPNHLDELGSPSQADTELQLDPSPAATSGFLNEVLNALYGDTTGHPENGSFSYHKAAEHYALNGVDYQLQSTTPSFTGEGGGGVPPKAQPPPGFERGAKALYDRKHPAIVGHNARAGAVSK